VDGFAVHAFNGCRRGHDISNVAYRRVGSASVSATPPLLVELPTLQKKARLLMHGALFQV